MVTQHTSGPGFKCRSCSLMLFQLQLNASRVVVVVVVVVIVVVVVSDTYKW